VRDEYNQILGQDGRFLANDGHVLYRRRLHSCFYLEGFNLGELGSSAGFLPCVHVSGLVCRRLLLLVGG